MREKDIYRVLTCGRYGCCFNLNTMLRKVLDHVLDHGADLHMALAARIDCNERDPISCLQQGQGVAEGARRLPAAIPGQHDAVADFAKSHLDRNYQNGRSGVHDDILREQKRPHGRRILGVRLAKDQQIGEPSMLGQQWGET